MYNSNKRRIMGALLLEGGVYLGVAFNRINICCVALIHLECD